jgi:DNA transposition AAA+ family ATPase
MRREEQKNMAEKRRLPPNLAALANVSRLLALVETVEGRGSSLPGLGVFHGEPGLGKTSAGTCCAVLKQTIHLTVGPFIRPKSLLQLITNDLGVRVPKKLATDDLFNLTCAALVDANRTLILDEADHLLSEATINTVRFLHDETRIPVILMGEENLPHRLLQFARVHSRVLERVGALEASMTDVDLLVVIEARGLEIATDLREALLVGSGHNHRYIVKNIDAIRRMALGAGLWRVTRADWGDRVFDKGDVAKPRNLPEHKKQPHRVQPYRMRGVA